MNRGYSQRMSFGPSVTPQIIKNLMIANAGVFFAQLLIPQVSALGVVIPERVWIHFEVWRPFTYMWLHSVGGLPMHLLMNLFMLWMFGSELALYWGEKRFLRYYLSCGIGAGLLIATLPFIPSLAGWWSPTTEELAKSTLGASGAIIAVLLAFSFTWPDRTIQLIFPPIPLKAIWLIPLVLVFEFATGSEDVSHVGHLGGLAIGWIYLLKEGKTPGVPTIETLKLFFQRHTTPKKSNAIQPRRRRSLKVRYQRYVMRKKLRSVQDEERTEPGRKKDDRTRR